MDTKPLWTAHYPNGLSWDYTPRNVPAFALLDDAVQNYGDHLCIDFLGTLLTYKEVGARVNQLAAGLQKLGIVKGDRVALFLPNCPYFVIAYFAILKMGGIVVNMNPLYAAQEVEHLLKDSGTKLLFTLDLKQFHEKLKPLLAPKTALEKLIICPLADALPWPKRLAYHLFKFRDKAHWHKDAQHLAWADVLAPESSPPAPVAITPADDVAVLQYTGGTTGISKGAMLTHQNIYTNADQAALWFQGSKAGEERMLGVIPFFHVFAMTVVMNMALRLGSAMILLPRFDLEEVLRTISHKKPTLFPAVPTIFTAIVNHGHLGRYKINSIRQCISGGAPLPVETKARFEGLTGCKLVEGYGLSETSPVVTCNPMFGVNKAGSIGLPLPGTWISIRALNNPLAEVPQGERGEVCIKGPQVMKGYWNNPSETANMLLDGGWIRTGDVGILDQDGYVSIVDRIKDMILCSGYNVYPRTVEEAIMQHAAVAEVTVIGVPDPYRGQTVKAFIVRRADMSLTEKELRHFLKDKLSPIELPKQIEFRESLPKTLIGKLSKKELRAEATTEPPPSEAPEDAAHS